MFDIHTLVHVYTLECHFKDNQISDFLLLPRPFYVIAFIVKGSAVYESRTDRVELAEGDLLFIPQGETYIAVWNGSGDMYCRCVYFSFSPGFADINDRKYFLQKITGPESESIKSTISSFFEPELSKDALPFEFLYKFYAMCELLFSELNYTKRENDLGIIQNAVNYIDANFKKSFSVKFLADLCCLSESRFYRVFKSLTGVSPITYKNRLIVNYAIESIHLHPGKTTEEISEECGFESPIYFRRLFKKLTGKTPGQMKKMDVL